MLNKIWGIQWHFKNFVENGIVVKFILMETILHFPSFAYINLFSSQDDRERRGEWGGEGRMGEEE